MPSDFSAKNPMKQARGKTFDHVAREIFTPRA
jgi:hypothetical protein